MKRYLWIMMAAAMAGSVLAVSAADQPAAPAASEKKATLTQAIYACPDCHTMALNAGKCDKCGKDMVKEHLLGTKDGEALVCACGAGCACDASKMKDGKCGCGKEVTKVSCKGMYVCPDGCPEISTTPGQCACGKDMTKCQ